jgi:hypothetical protein
MLYETDQLDALQALLALHTPHADDSQATDLAMAAIWLRHGWTLRAATTRPRKPFWTGRWHAPCNGIFTGW